MKTTVPILAIMTLIAPGLFAPAALAQDDDDDDGAATSTATATATSTATAGDDDDGVDDEAAALPSTGGPALVVPLAGALLLGSGIVAGFVGLRRNPRPLTGNPRGLHLLIRRRTQLVLAA